MDIDKENMTAFDAEEARDFSENLNPQILELLEEYVWPCKEDVDAEELKE